jgi:glycosyltransferase involved in cell wall biosynthesis
VKKILFIPPGIQGGWYMQAHYEYLIRYLSDEFFIEMAQVPYPPFENFLDRFPETSPLERSPEDYDLILPLLPSHSGVPTEDKWFKKMAIVMYEPGEGHWSAAKILGATTPVVEAGDYGDIPIHSLRFGVDTELFKPISMLREDNLLHVGVIGSYGSPRRMIEETIKPLYGLKGVRVMFFPQNWVNQGGTPEKIESLGGPEFIKRVVAGDRYWPGIPNLYNRMDVMVRVDASYGYSFPTLEAAACGVPVIVTDMGIDHRITDAEGGILIEGNPLGWINKGNELAEKVRKAVVWMRDHPTERQAMGTRARWAIEDSWTWYRFIPAWRDFFREATA